ncbi:hypothetical protein DVH24_005404 [Malus domestica]|uniref:Uncharacterized protein n=1 Tax=Malus domestica TaxID=3750 RepID=A0A498KKC7_MALDO|nr:hypothetical protein DVH24_005404 [Malus domestica]
MSSVSVHLLSAQRPHRRHREPDPSDHTSSASRVEGEASQPAKKKTRGPSRMLKLAQSVRLTGSKIKIEYDPHSIVVSCCGVVIKQNCPMQWEKWAEIPDRTKDLVGDKLSMTGLQISLPVPDFASPSTFEPLHPADTQ